jgi:hypothetical protein
MRFWSEFSMNNNASGTVKFSHVPYCVMFDYSAKTKFMAFFIPYSSETLAIVQHILDDYKSRLQDLDTKISISAGMAGDSAKTTLKEATFSGRIYVYYESDMNLQQLATWENVFGQQGVAVQFRGRDYQLIHANEKRQVANGPAPVQK